MPRGGSLRQEHTHSTSTGGPTVTPLFRPHCHSALAEAATRPQNAHTASHSIRSITCLRLSPEDPALSSESRSAPVMAAHSDGTCPDTQTRLEPRVSPDPSTDTSFHPSWVLPGIYYSNTWPNFVVSHIEPIRPVTYADLQTITF